MATITSRKHAESANLRHGLTFTPSRCYSHNLTVRPTFCRKSHLPRTSTATRIVVGTRKSAFHFWSPVGVRRRPHRAACAACGAAKVRSGKKSPEILHVFGPSFFGGSAPPPEFLDLIYLFPQVSDHVAKFHGDRSRDGGEKLAKEIKKKKTSRAK